MADKINSTTLSGGGVTGQPSSYVPGPTYQDGLTTGNGVAVFGGLLLDGSNYPDFQFRSLAAGDGITLALSNGSVVISSNVATPIASIYSPTNDIHIAISNTVATVSLYNTGVVAGTYSNPTFTVDEKGRIVTAEDGPTSNTNAVVIGIESDDLNVANSPVEITGTFVINLTNTGVTPGTYAYPTVTVDAKGRVSAITAGTVSNGTVRTVAAVGSNAIVVTGPPSITTVGAYGFDLSDTGVTAGTYTYSTIVVDRKGRITSAASGSAPTGNSGVAGVTRVALTGSNAITVTGSAITSTGTFGLDLSSTGVAAGTYAYATVTVDAKGRITSATVGTPVSTVSVNTDDMTIFGSNEHATGSVTSASGAVSIGLSNTGVTPGTYTSPNIVVDAKGRIRSLVSSGSSGTVTSVGLTVAGGGLNVSGSPITSSGSFTLSLAASGVTPGSYSKVTVDTTGRVIAGGSISNTDVVTALGFTPASTDAPVFLGAAKGITAGSGDSSLNLATTAFVMREIIARTGSSIALADLSNVSGTNLAAKQIVANSAVNARALRDHFASLGNIVDFKLANEDNYDNAFSRAFAVVNCVWLPAGLYHVTRPIILGSFQKIMGQGWETTSIYSSSASQPVVQIGDTANYFAISGVKLSHSVSPMSGGDGIQQAVSGQCNNGSIEDVLLTQNYKGLNAAMTMYTKLRNVIANSNVSDGFDLNADATGELLWNFESCVASLNGGHGWNISATGVKIAGTMIGALVNCSTSQNGQNGVGVYGSSQNAINAFDLNGGDYASDTGHSIYLDTYGAKATIRPVSVEKAGNNGIYVSNNNDWTHISVGHVVECANDGLLNWGRDTQVNGGQWADNGSAQTTGHQNGILCYSEMGKPSSTQIVGVRSGNRNNSGTQMWGISADEETMIVGCDLRGNVTAGYSGNAAVDSGNRLS